MDRSPQDHSAVLFERGTASLRLIDSRMRLADGLYAEYVSENELAGPSSAWSAGVMLSALNAAAAIDVNRLPAAVAYAKALDAYRIQKPGDVLGYQPFPVGNQVGDMYYDDNAWLVLAFLETYHLSGDSELLQRAQDAFNYLASGESDDLGGGIWWADFKKQKNTCSNAPAICAALALYDVTGDEKLLDFAHRIFLWVYRLQDADGLFLDHIERDGVTIDRTKWSYNSALMIRANLMLHRLTKDGRYIQEAMRILEAAGKKWFRVDGAIACEGAFAHLLCEAILSLDTRQVNTRDLVVQALNRLHDLRRDDGYPKRWDGWRPDECRIELLQQASAARAFLSAALHAR